VYASLADEGVLETANATTKSTNTTEEGFMVTVLGQQCGADNVPKALLEQSYGDPFVLILTSSLVPVAYAGLPVLRTVVKAVFAFMTAWLSSILIFTMSRFEARALDEAATPDATSPVPLDQLELQLSIVPREEKRVLVDEKLDDGDVENGSHSNMHREGMPYTDNSSSNDLNDLAINRAPVSALQAGAQAAKATAKASATAYIQGKIDDVEKAGDGVLATADEAVEELKAAAEE
jgi:hypothetical protein